MRDPNTATKDAADFSPYALVVSADAMTFRIRNGDVEIHWPLILLSLIPFNQTLTTISSVELFRRCSSVVEARLLSFWGVRNFKRGGELMIDVNQISPVSGINVQDERFPRTSSCSVQIETSQRKQVRQTKPCSKAPPTKKISLFDLKDNVFVILTGWWFGIDMRSTAKMDETGIKVSGWNYKSVGEVERKQKCKKKGIPIRNLMAQRRRKRRKHQYLKMQIVISTNDYRGSINFTTNLSQLDLDLRLQLPKLPLPSINTYNSYSFFSYQGVEVRLSAVNTRMICCRRPGSTGLLFMFFAR
ncbi:hypothetical protein Bca52824_060117 [Brassica carinata]|uniref:Uncharacterized protein n=1 Tax=Brassica carinata TaxID=52824 RepID=A0A8X7UG75_BRACI|nr:hypothetical protein Bca52824_060117 [Brassica carinata]